MKLMIISIQFEHCMIFEFMKIHPNASFILKDSIIYYLFQFENSIFKITYYLVFKYTSIVLIILLVNICFCI